MSKCKELTESILKIAGPKYESIESDEVDGVCVITITDNSDNNLLLNYEITTDDDGQSILNVNVIDKDEQTVVDDYETEFSDDEFDHAVSNSIETFEAIRSTRKVPKKPVKESTESNSDKFNKILEDGLKGIENLSDDELNQLDKFLLSDEVVKDNSQLTIDIAHFAIQKERDSRDRDKSRVAESIDVETALDEASIIQLIDVATTKLEAAAEDEEDDTVKRIIEDIIADVWDISEELSNAEL